MAKKKLGGPPSSIQEERREPSDKTIEVSWTDNEESHNMSVLLCGRSGAGKTHFASTFPEPRLWIDIDRGLRTVKNLHDPTISIRGHRDVWMRTLRILWAIGEGDRPFDKIKPATIIIDCMTRLSTLMEIEIIDNPPDSKERNEALFLSDYGLIKSRLVKMINTAKSIADVNLVCTMNVSPEIDVNDGAVDRPAMSGNKAATELVNYFDACLYLHRDKDVFTSNIAPTKRFPWARIRYPGGLPEGFPRSIVDLDYKILKSIDDGKYKPSKQSAQPEEDSE